MAVEHVTAEGRVREMRFAYTVHAQFDALEVAADWVAWLRDGHFEDVMKGGALEAMVVQLEPLKLEARYLFADREAFATYERDSAPKLRAEGLAKFPASRGVQMSRSMGDVLVKLP